MCQAGLFTSAAEQQKHISNCNQTGLCSIHYPAVESCASTRPPAVLTEAGRLSTLKISISHTNRFVHACSNIPSFCIVSSHSGGQSSINRRTSHRLSDTSVYPVGAAGGPTPSVVPRRCPEQLQILLLLVNVPSEFLSLFHLLKSCCFERDQRPVVGFPNAHEKQPPGSFDGTFKSDPALRSRAVNVLRGVFGQIQRV